MTGFLSTPTQKTSVEARAQRRAQIIAAIDEFDTPPRITHQEHVERLQQLQEVGKYTSALQEIEERRAKAQYALEDAEEDLDEVYDKASDSFQGMIKTFTPPASPSKAGKGAKESVTVTKVFTPPTSPSKAITVAPIVSGGRVELPVITPMSSPSKTVHFTAPAPPTAYYVVYHGRGGMQGVFENWKSPPDSYGPDCLCDGYEHRLSKKFNDGQRARMYYDECDESGVLNVLQDPPSPDELLIVIKGAQPGVYTKRLSFLIEGLAWRGGIVMTANGTRAQADLLFKQWKAAGRVEVLAANGPRRHF